MRSLFISILLSASVTVFGQEVYKVMHVKGQVKLVSTGVPLKRGDEIAADKRITFSSKQDMIMALSNKKGRVVIKPTSGSSSDSELTAMLKDIVTEASGKLSTRGIFSNRLDLENYLIGDFVVLGGEMSLRISPDVYKMDENNFFYIRYKYNDEEINKKL